MSSTSYITVKGSASEQIAEKKSKFICSIAHVQSEIEAEDFIKSAKKKYYDARHNVYAYIIGTGANKVKKYSDDGEPSRTGGFPVMEMLEQQGVTDVVCVVTRYFGGILLGTGGLIRAYTAAAQKALVSAGKSVLTLCSIIKITVPYNLLSNLEYIIKDIAVIESKDFANDVTITVYTQNEEQVINAVTQKFGIGIKCETVGTQYKPI